jgi:hypothetical protein
MTCLMDVVSKFIFVMDIGEGERIGTGTYMKIELLSDFEGSVIDSG